MCWSLVVPLLISRWNSDYFRYDLHWIYTVFRKIFRGLNLKSQGETSRLEAILPVRSAGPMIEGYLSVYISSLFFFSILSRSRGVEGWVFSFIPHTSPRCLRVSFRGGPFVMFTPYLQGRSKNDYETVLPWTKVPGVSSYQNVDLNRPLPLTYIWYPLTHDPPRHLSTRKHYIRFHTLRKDRTKWTRGRGP